ncbi:MAG: hypothetical protein NT069_29550 [Planctomycetota bacterium]|nr:hypothetical protein [Planctomycetota bacterium]
MSAWAYECQSRVDPGIRWFVSRTAVDEDVIVDSEFARTVAGESGAFLSEPPVSCETGSREDESESPPRTASSRQVTAAAITMAGVQFVVVLVGLSTVSGPGESDLVIADLEPLFGVPVVLMGQEEDGTPVYYGDPTLQELLAAVPVDRLPRPF